MSSAVPSLAAGNCPALTLRVPKASCLLYVWLLFTDLPFLLLWEPGALPVIKAHGSCLGWKQATVWTPVGFGELAGGIVSSIEPM